MKILGITMGVTATAAAMIDGEIVACVSEERFNRKKNYDGYPQKAIEYCVEVLGGIDRVIIASYNVDPAYIITHQESNRSVLDWVKEQEEYWYPKLYQGKDIKYVDIFKDKIDVEQFPGPDFWQGVDIESPERVQKFVEVRKRIVIKHLKLPEDKIHFCEHHLAHSMYAFYASPFRNEQVLCFTADGFGDYSNASLRIFKPNIHADKSAQSNMKITISKAVSSR